MLLGPSFLFPIFPSESSNPRSSGFLGSFVNHHPAQANLAALAARARDSHWRRKVGTLKVRVEW